MSVTIEPTRHVWNDQPDFFHCVCDECQHSMSFRRREAADAWAGRHPRECVGMPPCGHTPPHMVYRHSDGTLRCTAGTVVVPKIRDEDERIGALLQREYG